MPTFELTGDATLFWIMILIQSALIVWFLEVGNAVAATITLLMLMAGIALFPSQWPIFGLHSVADEGLWAWMTNNAGRLIALSCLYLLTGTAWALFRWWLMVSTLRERYEQRRAEWLTPGSLRRTAALLQSRAAMCLEPTERQRLIAWAEACQTAAMAGGQQLTRELKPVWKEFIEHGFSV